MKKYIFMTLFVLSSIMAFSAEESQRSCSAEKDFINQKIVKEIDKIYNACIGSGFDAECVSIFYKHNINTCYYYRHNKINGHYIAGIDDTDDNGNSFIRSSGLDSSWQISDQEFNEQKAIAQAWIRSQK